MENIRFSVIIPIFNGEKFLDECVNSVFCQSFKNYEVILIDDGSVDNSLTKCLQIQDEHKGLVKVFHQTNQGQIAARLKGIHEAVGEYCIFLDSDDTLTAQALEKINDAISQFATEIIVFNGFVESNHSRQSFWPHYTDRAGIINKDKFLREVIKSKRFNNICFKAIKRELLIKSKEYKKVEGVRLQEDLLMQLPYFDIAQSIAYIPEDLYFYRDNPNSVTNSYVSNKYEGDCIITDALLQYSKKWHVPNGERFCLIRHLDEVMVTLFHLRFSNKHLTKNQQLEYIKNIANDNKFRYAYKKAGKTKSKKSQMLMWALYHRLYHAVLFASLYL